MFPQLPEPSRLDRMLQPLTRLQRNDEVALVDNPDRMRWIVLRGMVNFVASVAALAVYQHTDFKLVAATFLGLQIGRIAFVTVRRPVAYRNGWIDGRRTMMSSLGESQRRGMPLDDWMLGEAERDLSIFTGMGVMAMKVEPGEMGHRVGGCEECARERDEYLAGGGDPAKVARSWHMAPPFEQEW
jgi:hypothetical protein